MRYKVAIKKFPLSLVLSEYKTNSLMDAYRHIGETLDNSLHEKYQAKEVNTLALKTGFYAVLYEWDLKEELFISLQIFQ